MIEGNLKENLRKSAFLNGVASAIDYSSKVIVGFIINPLIISFLGATYYGIWQIISQLNSYMSTADIQAGNTLRFLLSKNRSTSDEITLKKYVSAALYSNFFFIPLYSIIGLLIIWLSPYFSGVTKDYFLVVRYASSFLVLSFITIQFFFLFESTLNGMNLAYKRIGIRAGIILFGGILIWLALYLGYGIIGMAIAQLITGILTGVSFWVIVKKQLSWFEFVKVEKSYVFEFIKKSSWFMLMKFVGLLNSSTDLLMLGLLTGPKIVAVYSITKYAMTSGLGFIKTSFASITIGLGKYLGEKRFDKIHEARIQVYLLQWVVIAILGSMICLFNKPFVSFWTNSDMFAGHEETFLIVIVAAFNILMQFDGNIINMSFDVKRKVLALLITSVLTLALMALLIPLYQIIGLLISLLIGSILLSLYFSHLVNTVIQNKQGIMKLFINRKSIVGFTLIILSSYISTMLTIVSWWSLFLSVLAAIFFISIIIYFLMLSKNERGLLLSNFQKSKIFQKIYLK